MKTTKKIIKNRSDFSNRQEHKYNIYAGSTPLRYDKSNTEDTIKHFNNKKRLYENYRTGHRNYESCSVIELAHKLLDDIRGVITHSRNTVYNAI